MAAKKKLKTYHVEVDEYERVTRRYTIKAESAERARVRYTEGDFEDVEDTGDAHPADFTITRVEEVK